MSAARQPFNSGEFNIVRHLILLIRVLLRINPIPNLESQTPNPEITLLISYRGGLQVSFSLGFGSSFNGTANAWNASQLYSVAGSQSVVATSGATWYVTGVQLEVGTAATAFELRPYGTELQLCQRYIEVIKMQDSGNETLTNIAFVYTNPSIFMNYPHKVVKRSQPGVTLVGAASSFQALTTGGTWNQANGISATTNQHSSRIILTMASWSGFTLGNAAETRADTGGGKLYIDAEL